MTEAKPAFHTGLVGEGLWLSERRRLISPSLELELELGLGVRLRRLLERVRCILTNEI